MADSLSVEASRAKRAERLQSRFRDRGGVFVPATHNTLLDALLARGVDGESPTKARARRRSTASRKSVGSPLRADAQQSARKGKPRASIAPKAKPRKSIKPDDATINEPGEAKERALEKAAKPVSKPRSRKSTNDPQRSEGQQTAAADEPVAGPSRSHTFADNPSGKKPSKSAPLEIKKKSLDTKSKSTSSKKAAPSTKKALTQSAKPLSAITEADEEDEDLAPPTRPTKRTRPALAAADTAEDEPPKRKPAKTAQAAPRVSRAPPVRGPAEDDSDDIPLVQLIKSARGRGKLKEQGADAARPRQAANDVADRQEPAAAPKAKAAKRKVPRVPDSGDESGEEDAPPASGRSTKASTAREAPQKPRRAERAAAPSSNRKRARDVEDTDAIDEDARPRKARVVETLDGEKAGQASASMIMDDGAPAKPVKGSREKSQAKGKARARAAAAEADDHDSARKDAAARKPQTSRKRAREDPARRDDHAEPAARPSKRAKVPASGAAAPAAVLTVDLGHERSTRKRDTVKGASNQKEKVAAPARAAARTKKRPTSVHPASPPEECTDEPMSSATSGNKENRVGSATSEPRTTVRRYQRKPKPRLSMFPPPAPPDDDLDDDPLDCLS
ncbi:hypothetical protein WOLCODRAFT_164235 [Wolfiporia cocos MD-104 SS10]|uniref:Uncharacterized protein n=1 Tax=Wolfiporia cocos (strain MD-104) TaxID=742152 RepID=A0A2H3JNM1_WOLCO|nr:hypothetical protein WOLCODRAFT_164235 [Wolfiporia cocos MD-104 SS10]